MTPSTPSAVEMKLNRVPPKKMRWRPYLRTMGAAGRTMKLLPTSKAAMLIGARLREPPAILTTRGALDMTRVTEEKARAKHDARRESWVHWNLERDGMQEEEEELAAGSVLAGSVEHFIAFIVVLQESWVCSSVRCNF